MQSSCVIGRQPARFVITAGGDDVDAYHRVGTVKLLGRFETAAVDLQHFFFFFFFAGGLAWLSYVLLFPTLEALPPPRTT